MTGTHPWGVEISYSQLRAYLNCPWLYKLRYIKGRRVSLTPPASLGLSIHGALETFHAKKGADFEALLDAFEERWVHKGYASAVEQMEWHRKGEEILKTYWECESKSASRIVGVEREFVFPLENHKVRGKIDRIDQRPDGSYEVVDYKTHLDVASEEVTAADLQLRIYALAARHSLKLKPAWLSFYYVAAGGKVTVPYDGSGERELKALLAGVADEIASERESEPDRTFCPKCDYRTICPRSAAE